MNMAQLMENAELADDMIRGKPDEDGFKTRRKESQGRQFSAKGNVTSRLTVPPFKEKPFAGKDGHFANECPQRNSQDKDDKSDRNGRKPKPSARLVPDLVGDQQNMNATKLCRGWGKRDGYDRRGRIGLSWSFGACHSYSGKAPSVHQSYVDAEEFLLCFGKARFRKMKEGWKIHNAFHVSLLRPSVGDVPEDLVPKEQPEMEELDEILVPEQILAHKERKARGKVARRYLVKFKNYSPMDAKWMEETELADSPHLLQLYLEAFQLQPTVT
ncbi:hypothetical protein L7F22_028965 [Adiantum nelumboides]|nr:hypothetical protein [Adiantum nelumboides]